MQIIIGFDYVSAQQEVFYLNGNLANYEQISWPPKKTSPTLKGALPQHELDCARRDHLEPSVQVFSVWTINWARTNHFPL